MCDRWANSFEAFLEDMGPKPSLQHSIERKQNSIGYEPENCKWATPKEQARNRRNNRLVTLGDRRQTLAEWAGETGIHIGVLWYRFNRGWSPERALTTSTVARQRHISHEAA